MEIENLISRCKKKDNSKEEWMQLKEDMISFLHEDHPESEKKRLRPLGYLEIVAMMCDDSADD